MQETTNDEVVLKLKFSYEKRLYKFYMRSSWILNKD